MGEKEGTVVSGVRCQVVTRAEAKHPFAVAVGGGWVFWSDWVARAVLRADKRAGGARALRRHLPRPMALVVVAPQHQTCVYTYSTVEAFTNLWQTLYKKMYSLGEKDPCSILNGGCAELCTLSPAGQVACACGAGRELARDGLACAGAGRAACEAGQWPCAEGGCVPLDLVCDGVPHCGDGQDASDEDLYYCSECRARRPLRCQPVSLVTCTVTVCDSVAHVRGGAAGVRHGRALRGACGAVRRPRRLRRRRRRARLRLSTHAHQVRLTRCRETRAIHHSVK